MAKIDEVGGIWPAFLLAAPELVKAARVARASTSSGLYRTDTGEHFPGSGGAHHYILVKDGSDIERFLKDLHARCWLLGFGWHIIGKAGLLLERSVVDCTVGFGERLCFESAPVVRPPLAQDSAKRFAEAFEGEPIDTTVVVRRLTEYEIAQLREAQKASAALIDKAATEVRLQYDHELAEKIAAAHRIPFVTALRLVTSRHRGTLLPYFKLEFDHLGTLSVADVLSDPDRFIGQTLADPMEGPDYGRNKAKIVKANGGGIIIHSFAHGRQINDLRYDARSAMAAVEAASEEGIVDFAMGILANVELEADEREDFAKALSAKANVGVRAISARVKKEHQKREESQKRSAADLDGDKRIIKWRPPDDGELRPTATFLDELLAKDKCDEPPMRDASGNLVEVRVHEPWSMHLLTSGGSNDVGEEQEAMKAPPEPGLFRLTHTAVEMMLERYVCWKVTVGKRNYLGALHRSHLEALMQFSPSGIPIVRSLNTVPLVDLHGNLIDGSGLDRATGLFHRIEPSLRECVPVETPTEDDVRAALRFLMEQWLVDVALPPAGKLVAIMLALTLLERALLPERPAFFVTAGQRGGGKTTLVNMITLAVLGRRASANAWSNNPEERKKALFAYLRQGGSCLVWDNIYRGASISCPHIEAAITATEISDRVLGESRAETVASTAVQIFTGNAILPRGDMASRSLILLLDVDRPDPENRNFNHPDPLAWTEESRSKIMRALCVLLIAGGLNRPKSQVAKTRFKTWWKLVGWPVEFAAGLIGIDIDCTALMRMAEAGDEEASAVSLALNTLMDIFQNNSFSSREIVDAIEYAIDAHWKGAVDEVKNVRGEALLAALSELIGKRLERPTAHSVGKLLQARLVGRPGWIGDGSTAAILKRKVGHNENSYSIETLGSAGAPSGTP